MRRALRWTGLLVLCALIVGAGFVLGLRLAGTDREETELGQVSYRMSVSPGGGLEGYVPVTDWGVRVDGPSLPVRLRAELRTLDRDALLRAAQGDRHLIDRTEREVRNGAVSAVGKNLLWAMAVTLVLLVLVSLIWRGLRPRWAPVAIGMLMFVVAVVSAGLITRSSFNQNALGNPTFFASGQELQRILEVVDKADVDSPYGSEFESIVRSIGAVLSTDQDLHSETTGIYLGSDLHANALVVGPLSRLVAGQPLLLAGDFGQRGTPAEAALLAPRIASLGRRVVAVSGNHDSARLMRALSGEGVTVLSRKGVLEPDGSVVPPPVVNVAGVRVAGWSDPFEFGGTNRRRGGANDFDDFDDPGAVRAKWVAGMVRWFGALKTKPDVVMIHQSSLASLFAKALDSGGYRRPLTVATGHSHEQYVERVGSVVIVNAGSTGAGGVFEAGTAGIGLAHLRFERRGALRSAELILAEPFSGAAQATRVVIDSLCPDEPECKVEVPNRLDESSDG